MTEEQIIQNAEAYADVFGRHMADYYGVKDAFISGAHSRDEEIKELKSLIKMESEIREGLLRDKHKLQDELDQLRNPWISVEERLPEIDQTQHTKKKNWSIAVLVHDIDILHDALGQAYPPDVARYDYERKDWLYVEPGCYANEIEIGAEITHWMPIPELKKGE